MFNENVCAAYCQNTFDRRYTTNKWSQIWEQVPIGVPMRAKEIVEQTKIKTLWGGEGAPMPQTVAAMFKAMARVGFAKIEKEIFNPPLEFEIPQYKWGYDKKEGWTEIPIKPITIKMESRNIYTRLV